MWWQRIRLASFTRRNLVWPRNPYYLFSLRVIWLKVFIAYWPIFSHAEKGFHTKCARMKAMCLTLKVKGGSPYAYNTLVGQVSSFIRFVKLSRGFIPCPKIFIFFIKDLTFAKC